MHFWLSVFHNILFAVLPFTVGMQLKLIFSHYHFLSAYHLPPPLRISLHICLFSDASPTDSCPTNTFVHDNTSFSPSLCKLPHTPSVHPELTVLTFPLNLILLSTKLRRTALTLHLYNNITSVYLVLEPF